MLTRDMDKNECNIGWRAEKSTKTALAPLKEPDFIISWKYVQENSAMNYDKVF